MRKVVIVMMLLCSAMGVEAQEHNCGKCSKEVNPVIDAIMSRTSIRQYQERAVGSDTIEILLRAGMAAPTAVNKQPWYFVVVQNPETLEALGGRSKEAPLAIVVCGDMTKALEGDAREYWVQDCSAATENILLAAHALGLGAVWQGVYPISRRVENVSKLLNLSENLIPLNVIAIGYPAESPEPKNKWKLENVCFE